MPGGHPRRSLRPCRWRRDRLPIRRRRPPARLRAAPVHDRCVLAGPHTRAFLDRLIEHVRLIVFNPRGTGLSDRPRSVTLESRMDDINAVMDAEAHRVEPSLFGVAESANACALFASTYPERCQHLILHWPYADDGRGRGDEERLGPRDAESTGGNATWMEEFASRDQPRLRERSRADGLVRVDAARCGEPERGRGFHSGCRWTPTSATSSRRSGCRRWSCTPRARATQLGRSPNASPTPRCWTLPSEGLDPYTDTEQLTELIIRAAHRGAAAARCPSPCSRPCCSPISPIRPSMAAELGDEAWRRTVGPVTMLTSGVSSQRFRGIEVDTAGRRVLLPVRRTGTGHRVRPGDRRRSGRARGLVVRAGIHTGECAVIGSGARRGRGRRSELECWARPNLVRCSCHGP